MQTQIKSFSSANLKWRCCNILMMKATLFPKMIKTLHNIQQIFLHLLHHNFFTLSFEKKSAYVYMIYQKMATWMLN